MGPGGITFCRAISSDKSVFSIFLEFSNKYQLMAKIPSISVTMTAKKFVMEFLYVIIYEVLFICLYSNVWLVANKILIFPFTNEDAAPAFINNEILF